MILALVLHAGLSAPPSRLRPVQFQLDDRAPAELQRLLARRVPNGWTVSDPQTPGDAPEVHLGIPDRWRGSPVSAAMALCPDPDSEAWRNPVLQGGLLRLVVRYQNRDWPPYDCRP